jgi:hypothetical protein
MVRGKHGEVGDPAHQRALPADRGETGLLRAVRRGYQDDRISLAPEPFTERVFYPGRWVRLAYNYDVKRYPSMLAIVRSFDLASARDHPQLREVYPQLRDDDEFALITLDVQR